MLADAGLDAVGTTPALGASPLELAFAVDLAEVAVGLLELLSAEAELVLLLSPHEIDRHVSATAAKKDPVLVMDGAPE